MPIKSPDRKKEALQPTEPLLSLSLPPQPQGEEGREKRRRGVGGDSTPGVGTQKKRRREGKRSQLSVRV